MDFADVMRQVGAFFIRMCAIEVTFADISFTLGSMYLWGGLVAIFLFILRGLSS